MSAGALVREGFWKAAGALALAALVGAAYLLYQRSRPATARAEQQTISPCGR